MNQSDAEKIIQHIHLLPDFVIYTSIDGNYNHIGATLADAILQANMRYATHVKPRVNRILASYSTTNTTSALNELLKKICTREFLNWRGENRIDRFNQVLSLLSDENIETEGNLRNWLLDNNNLPKLRSINGIGPKTVDYFKILVGISTSAIDRHLLDFLIMAGLKPNNYSEAQTMINAAADKLSIDRAQFDHSIWQFMSKRAASTGGKLIDNVCKE